MSRTRFHDLLDKMIKEDDRDIALISLPGMGLSSVLDYLRSMYQGVYVSCSQIITLWEQDYSKRQRGKRFLLDASTLISLKELGFFEKELTQEDICKTNLPNALRDGYIIAKTPIFVLIDSFDGLDKDVAKLLCDRVKALRDEDNIENIRFVFGGAIDFHQIYDLATSTGTSPATNFHKYFPYEFLLSEDEGYRFLDSNVPKLSQLSDPDVKKIIVSWSGGYVHYLVEFAKWILDESHNADLNSHTAIQHLFNAVENNDRLALFRHCRKSWESIKSETDLVDLLEVALTVGRVHDTSGKCRSLMKLGLLINRRGEHNVYSSPNIIIEIYLRQRFAELGRLLPPIQSTTLMVIDLNVEAYRLILEIENRLRTFIGDLLFAKYKSNWLEDGLKDIEIEKGKTLTEKIRAYMQQDQRSVYAGNTSDPELTFLDFSDLALITTNKKQIFENRYTQFAQEASDFIDEINYYRRRVAHSRFVSADQLQALRTRWKHMQNLMKKRA